MMFLPLHCLFQLVLGPVVAAELSPRPHHSSMTKGDYADGRKPTVQIYINDVKVNGTVTLAETGMHEISCKATGGPGSEARMIIMQNSEFHQTWNRKQRPAESLYQEESARHRGMEWIRCVSTNNNGNASQMVITHLVDIRPTISSQSSSSAQTIPSLHSVLITHSSSSLSLKTKSSSISTLSLVSSSLLKTSTLTSTLPNTTTSTVNTVSVVNDTLQRGENLVGSRQPSSAAAIAIIVAIIAIILTIDIAVVLLYQRRRPENFVTTETNAITYTEKSSLAQLIRYEKTKLSLV